MKTITAWLFFPFTVSPAPFPQTNDVFNIPIFEFKLMLGIVVDDFVNVNSYDL